MRGVSYVPGAKNNWETVFLEDSHSKGTSCHGSHHPRIELSLLWLTPPRHSAGPAAAHTSHAQL